MSQTDTPRQAGDASRRVRGRRRRDSHMGERCPMCRQIVVVDTMGRCALGHQVMDRAALAELAALAEEAELDELALGHDEPVIDLDLDTAPVASLGFAVVGGGGVLPRRVVPRAEPEPELVALDEPTPAHSNVELAAQLVASAMPSDRVSRWVPGIRSTGLRLEPPTLLPDRAAGRRLAQPDDRPLPVMEPTPPLPGPPPEDGPAVARALFTELHGDIQPVEALPQPPARPAVTDELPVREIAVMTVAPVQPSTVPSALGSLAAGRQSWVTAADLSPSAPSVLDLDGLPHPSPRAEPVFEQAELEVDLIASRGPAQWLAAALFIAALCGAAWYLATTL